MRCSYNGGIILCPLLCRRKLHCRTVHNRGAEHGSHSVGASVKCAHKLHSTANLLSIAESNPRSCINANRSPIVFSSAISIVLAHFATKLFVSFARADQRPNCFSDARAIRCAYAAAFARTFKPRRHTECTRALDCSYWALGGEE